VYQIHWYTELLVYILSLGGVSNTMLSIHFKVMELLITANCGSEKMPIVYFKITVRSLCLPNMFTGTMMSFTPLFILLIFCIITSLISSKNLV